MIKKNFLKKKIFKFRKFKLKLGYSYFYFNTFFKFFNYFSRNLTFKHLMIKIKSPLAIRYHIKLLDFYDKLKYYCFLKKTLNNLFLTITNNRGDVILTLSAGNVKIKTKKKKNSAITLREILKKASLLLISKKIFNISSLLVTSPNRILIRNTLLIFNQFSISVQDSRYITPRTHSFIYKKKKIRRI